MSSASASDWWCWMMMRENVYCHIVLLTYQRTTLATISVVYSLNIFQFFFFSLFSNISHYYLPVFVTKCGYLSCELCKCVRTWTTHTHTLLSTHHFIIISRNFAARLWEMPWQFKRNWRWRKQWNDRARGREREREKLHITTRMNKQIICDHTPIIIVRHFWMCTWIRKRATLWTIFLLLPFFRWPQQMLISIIRVSHNRIHAHHHISENCYSNVYFNSHKTTTKTKRTPSCFFVCQLNENRTIITTKDYRTAEIGWK